jgi:anti-anti-sigma regulatory factor
VISCEIELSGTATVVNVRGELELSTVADVRASLNKALAEHPVAIVVDLTDVVVTDDITLTVFSAFAKAAAAWPGCPVLLCNADPQVVDDLNRLAVTRTAPVHGSRAEAIAVSRETSAPARVRSVLPPGTTALALARDVVRDTCHAWNLADLVDDAEVVVNEIVANAVQHAGGPIDVVLTRRTRYLHMSVRDRSHAVPCRSIPDPETLMGGRGLLLLDAIAAGWGTTATDYGKAVWATLRIDPRATGRGRE